MRKSIAVFACLSGLAAQPCLAQQTVAEQQEAVALDTARQALSAARQKQVLDALAAIKQPAEGTAEVKNGAASAEALLLADQGRRDAAALMARQVAAWLGKPPTKLPLLVVEGSQAPSVAQWLAFNRMSKIVKRELEEAAEGWDRVKNAKLPAPAANKGTNFSVLGSPLPLALISTIAGLVKTDYNIEGAKIDVAAGVTRSAAIEALRAEGVCVSDPDLSISKAGGAVSARLGELDAARTKAATAYRNGYLKAVADEGTDKLPDVKKQAGANLAAALADYDTLVKGLYTPQNGMLPAVEIERQHALLDNRATQTILYLTHVDSAISVVTKKNFLSGISSVPASLRVATTIDYALVKGDAVTTGHVRAATASTPFEKKAGAVDQAPALAPCS